MRNFFIILKALFSGYFTGLLISLPLGPASIESVKRTVSKSYKEGFTVSLGALSADLTYIFLINYGFLRCISRNSKFESLFWIFSGVIVFSIGYKSINNSSSSFSSIISVESNNKSAPYLTGFIITFSNPMTPALWFTLSGTVISFWLYISKSCYYTFLVSIGAGMITWFAILNYLALKGFKFLTPKQSKYTNCILMSSIIIIGICFIIFGTIKLFLKY